MQRGAAQRAGHQRVRRRAQPGGSRQRHRHRHRQHKERHPVSRHNSTRVDSRFRHPVFSKQDMVYCGLSSSAFGASFENPSRKIARPSVSVRGWGNGPAPDRPASDGCLQAARCARLACARQPVRSAGRECEHTARACGRAPSETCCFEACFEAKARTLGRAGARPCRVIRCRARAR